MYILCTSNKLVHMCYNILCTNAFWPFCMTCHWFCLWNGQEFKSQALVTGSVHKGWCQHLFVVHIALAFSQPECDTPLLSRTCQKLPSISQSHWLRKAYLSSISNPTLYPSPNQLIWVITSHRAMSRCSFLLLLCVRTYLRYSLGVWVRRGLLPAQCEVWDLRAVLGV